MSLQLKLIILWILCVIGMILHFNYHVSELFYGIDIISPDANGEVPLRVFVIRSVFYHMPFVWILLIMFKSSVFWRLSLFSISVLYAIAHLGHLIGEIANPKRDISQMALLFTVLVTSIVLAAVHYQYWKQAKDDH